MDGSQQACKGEGKVDGKQYYQSHADACLLPNQKKTTLTLFLAPLPHAHNLRDF
jgi:hypothetical protein